MKQRLVIIRGLPGSGKSTLAKESFKGFAHYEADMYFIGSDGKYEYVAADITDAHEWCQRSVFKALSMGKDVVVSNTFTRKYEMQPYFDIAETFGVLPEVITVKGEWMNVHGVPESVIQKMKNRWED